MGFFSSNLDGDLGIYSVFDPELSSNKFSPPFFAVNDDLAMQALLETLRRRVTSFEALYASEFRRMVVWRVGTCLLSSGEVRGQRKFRRRVCSVAEYLDRAAVRSYMQSATYPTKDDLER